MGFSAEADWEPSEHAFVTTEHHLPSKQERAGEDTYLDLLLHQREPAGEDAGERFLHILDLSRPGITASSTPGGNTPTPDTEREVSPGGASTPEESTHEDASNIVEGATPPAEACRYLENHLHLKILTPSTTRH